MEDTFIQNSFVKYGSDILVKSRYGLMRLYVRRLFETATTKVLTEK